MLDQFAQTSQKNMIITIFWIDPIWIDPSSITLMNYVGLASTSLTAHDNF